MNDDIRHPVPIDAAIDEVARRLTHGEPGARFQRDVTERIRRRQRRMIILPTLVAATAVLVLVALWTVPWPPQDANEEPGGPVQQVQRTPDTPKPAAPEAQVTRRVGPAPTAFQAPIPPNDVAGIEPIVVTPITIAAIDIASQIPPADLTVPEIGIEPLTIALLEQERP
jgi:hypothetical protein